MMEAIQLSKKTLRNEIKQKIEALSTNYKNLQTDIVLKKLFSLPVYKHSRRISVYLSTKDEICTEAVLRDIFRSEKLCFVPRYNNQVMEMVKLDSMKDYECLPVTKWNIKQPSLTDCRENPLETGSLDLIIVPGVAFTVNGTRLGHGKGYYDSFLSKCFEIHEERKQQRPKTVALAFKEQIVEDIPCHEHDVKVDFVLYPDLKFD